MARYDKVVLDSSVIVKWFTTEDGSEKSISYLDSFIKGSLSIAVSELVFYEVANALRYNPAFTSSDVKSSVEHLLNLKLDAKSLNAKLVKESAEIAFDCNVTFYDAVPVALAKIEEVQCITADRTSQFARLSPKGYPVKLLE
ncbi:MAG: type II toxin-antitoxin system VapC family toxin [Thaumarchaeota archaeon]|nr:type II toxin-antitoxin system VapC family toxin [Nitrososphaerota archaeon]